MALFSKKLTLNTCIWNAPMVTPSLWMTEAQQRCIACAASTVFPSRACFYTNALRSTCRGIASSSSKSDKCVYVKGQASRQILLVWVDDIILATARVDDAARKKFDAYLCSEFEVSSWASGEPNFIHLEHEHQEGLGSWNTSPFST